jgi:hypothetical protein
LELGQYKARFVALKAAVIGFGPGANPTITSYNASVVEICNPTSSLVHFESKNISSTLQNALAYYNAGGEVVVSEVVGLVLEKKLRLLNLQLHRLRCS